jgi:hypothetical protein
MDLVVMCRDTIGQCRPISMTYLVIYILYYRIVWLVCDCGKNYYDP